MDEVAVAGSWSPRVPGSLAEVRLLVRGELGKTYEGWRPSADVTRPVRVRLFATARLVVGQATLLWPVPEQGLSARDLAAALGEAYPRLAPTLRVSRFLRNDRYLHDLGETLRPGDEFAVHPPYGGG